MVQFYLLQQGEGKRLMVTFKPGRVVGLERDEVASWVNDHSRFSWRMKDCYFSLYPVSA